MYMSFIGSVTRIYKDGNNKDNFWVFDQVSPQAAVRLVPQTESDGQAQQER